MELQDVEGSGLILTISQTRILIDMAVQKQLQFNTENDDFQVVYESNWLKSIEFDTIDIIIICNILTVNGLPAIPDDFNGKILLTEPVFKIGTAICNEFLHYSQLYTEDQVLKVWNKITFLSYNERFCFKDISLTAISSGHSIGSANWIIRYGDINIGIMGNSCLDGGRYPQQFNMAITQCDYVILTPSNVIIQQPLDLKSIYEGILEAFRSLAFESSVFIPLETWEILDIEDFIIQAAKTFNINIYVVSPSAKTFFAYTAGLTEWLNNRLRQKSFEPAICFNYEQSIEDGSMKVYESLNSQFYNDFEQRCVMLATDSTLRQGDGKFIFKNLLKSRQGQHIVFYLGDIPSQNLLYQLKKYRFEELRERLQIGLTISEYYNLLMSTKVIAPIQFQELKSINIQFFEKNQELSISAQPKTMGIQVNLPKDTQFLIGVINYNNYKFRGNFDNFSQCIVDKLKDFGAIYQGIKQSNQRLKITIGEASILLKKRKIIIKTQNLDLLHSLTSVINFDN